MSGELRPLGIAHGLLLGLLLASPLLAPGLMSWGMEALFILGGFQLRLADRRQDMRRPLSSWVSHIRMAPRRLLPWGAAATVALIARDAPRAQAVLLAAAMCELLLYPVVAPVLGRLPRHIVIVVLILLMALSATAAGDMIRYSLAFGVGVTACLFWLRGPDGDVRALALAMAGSIAAALCALAIPAATPLALSAAIVCATLALAHLSVQRRRPVPWRPTSGAPFTRRSTPLR